MIDCFGLLVLPHLLIGGGYMDVLPVIPEIRIWIQTIASILLVIIAIWSYKKQKKEKTQ